MPHPSEPLRPRYAVRMANSHNVIPAPRPTAIATALIVEPNLVQAVAIASALTESWFNVTIADTFQKARTALTGGPPAVLVTEIRLAEYNGLHLVIYGKSIRPEMAALVMSSEPDSVLESEAEALGATYMIKPVSGKDAQAALLRTISRLEIPARSLDPIRPPFERRVRERRAAGGAAVAADRRRGDRRRDLAKILDPMTKRR